MPFKDFPITPENDIIGEPRTYGLGISSQSWFKEYVQGLKTIQGIQNAVLDIMAFNVDPKETA